MSRVLKNWERVTKSYLAKQIPVNIKIHGVDCQILKPDIKTKQTDVYGKYSGFNRDNANAYNARILINSMQWRVITNSEGGWYDDPGYFYTSSEIEINDGDQIVVQDVNAPPIHLVVVNVETIGIQEKIITRFRISNEAGV